MYIFGEEENKVSNTKLLTLETQHIVQLLDSSETLENDNFVASVYADNSLEVWRLREMGVLWRLHRSVCTDRCLLTSAAILGSEIKSLSVVAGSMMNTVHCWNPYVPRGFC